ncbi:hypothetical protein CTI14_63740, partial [Methylobacterium radiotolerans]
DLPPTARVFLCGPLPFMQAIRNALTARGIAPERIEYEVFGPDLWARQPKSGAGMDLAGIGPPADGARVPVRAAAVHAGDPKRSDGTRHRAGA